MLNQVQYRNDSIVINKDGKPVAVLVDAELFARTQRMRDRFDASSARIADAYVDVPIEEGLAEIDALLASHANYRCAAARSFAIPHYTQTPKQPSHSIAAYLILR